MNILKVIKKLPDTIFTRKDILFVAQQLDTSFENTQLRYIIGKLLKDNKIVRVGHNRYIKNKTNKKNYENIYSPISKKIISFMNKKFPLVDYRIWELSWLNEFFNHQIAKNKIFLEIEKKSCEFIYNEISERERKKILLIPTTSEILLYGNEKNIIINKLTSEAPKGEKNFYNLCLEKLIVDMFSNKLLKNILSKGDYPSAISEIFDKYNINQTKMLRYADRKNKREEISKFLKEKTNIKFSGI